MRSALPLVVLIVLAGCDAAVRKPAVKPSRPASTSKPRPPASLPMPKRAKPPMPVWQVVRVAAGHTPYVLHTGRRQCINYRLLALPNRC
jgi:hypothetical protein